MAASFQSCHISLMIIRHFWTAVVSMVFRHRLCWKPERLLIPSSLLLWGCFWSKTEQFEMIVNGRTNGLVADLNCLLFQSAGVCGCFLQQKPYLLEKVGGRWMKPFFSIPVGGLLAKLRLSCCKTSLMVLLKENSRWTPQLSFHLLSFALFTFKTSV